ncbi:MAG: response regulator [Candidatus Heimdallarchaeota archaeon]|nr:response regulator [Candidatus Heimdallarchaeota archaeon]
MKVVVIDDSRLSVSALQNMLNKLGHEVVGTAFNGTDGAAVCKKERPDVVCLDFVMPDKDGLETAKLIRESQPTVKIIMITQKELDAGTKAAINAIAHVIKPITQDKLEAAFNKL